MSTAEPWPPAPIAPWPPAPPRRYGKWLALGGCTGALGCAALVVLAVVCAVVALVAMVFWGRIWEPGAPGDALVLTNAEAAGVWEDGRGGSLVLAGDGTFSASSACGDYFDPQSRASSGFGLAPSKTGTGTWELRSASTVEGGPRQSTVDIAFGPGGVSSSYEATGTTAAPMLWAYIGDPDDGDRCILKKAAVSGAYGETRSEPGTGVPVSVSASVSVPTRDRPRTRAPRDCFSRDCTSVPTASLCGSRPSAGAHGPCS
ncbi:hypothetical protein AB4039_12770 [Streptomyces sp. M-16]|uniref:hypothetical protein n=1 Tax=Streptomyces sp. M-16 TaxID=3233040 RepID=UPI0022574806